MKKFIGRKEDVFLLVSIILVVYAIFYVLMYRNLKLDSWAKLIGIAFALIEFIEIVIGIYNKSLINETKVFVENSLLSFVIVSGFISIIVIWQIQVIMRINIKKLLLK